MLKFNCVMLFYSIRFFSDVFGSHLGVPKTKYDPPTDNVTLWHVYKTSTVRPSIKHVSQTAYVIAWLLLYLLQ